jgi:K+-transporting ATPase A subunit
LGHRFYFFLSELLANSIVGRCPIYMQKKIDTLRYQPQKF